MRLGHLATVDLPGRSDWLIAHHSGDLTGALAFAARQGLPSEAVCEVDLAWAVAFNLATSPGETDAGLRKVLAAPGSGLPPLFTPDTPFIDYWESMTRPRRRSRTTTLADLAWSVACEQRPDWHRPSAARSTADAEAAFHALLHSLLPPLRDFLVGHYRDRLDREDIESAVDRAWAEFYRAFWSQNAEQRFLALTTLSSVLS